MPYLRSEAMDEGGIRPACARSVTPFSSLRNRKCSTRMRMRAMKGMDATSLARYPRYLDRSARSVLMRVVISTLYQWQSDLSCTQIARL